jgi:hypothetical protein
MVRPLVGLLEQAGLHHLPLLKFEELPVPAIDMVLVDHVVLDQLKL